MNKLALMTLGIDGRSEFGKVELGIYEARQRVEKGIRDEVTRHYVEEYVIEQMKGRQFLASKTFNDDRNVETIVKDLTKRFGGTGEGHGVGGHAWVGIFPISALNEIVDYLKNISQKK